MVKAGIWIGSVLALAGSAVLACYWTFFLLRGLFSSSQIPLMVKIATPVIMGGLFLLVLSVVGERLGSKRQERFEEIDY